MVDILIVEDQKDLGQLLTDFLRAEKYVVSCVETAEKALALYDKYGARLLVLDLCLPQMDGLAVLNHVRKSANTPVLVVSAKNAKDDKLNAILAGRTTISRNRTTSISCWRRSAASLSGGSPRTP